MITQMPESSCSPGPQRSSKELFFFTSVSRGEWSDGLEKVLSQRVS